MYRNPFQALQVFFGGRRRARPGRLPLLLAAAFLIAPAAAGAEELVDLFYVQNSKSINEVHYQVRLDRQCRPVAADPIRVYWRQFSEGSGPEDTRELKWVEQKFAYGVDVHLVDDHRVQFAVVADEDRPIRVQTGRSDGVCQAHAYTEIRGEWARADHVFVQVVPRRFAWPKVPWVDVVGKDRSGRPTCERVLDPDEPTVDCPEPALQAALKRGPGQRATVPPAASGGRADDSTAPADE